MLPTFDVLHPRTLDEACALLAQHAPDGVAVLAGGTDLLVNLRLPVIPEELTRRWGGVKGEPPRRPTVLIALSRLPDLSGIGETDEGIAIGAMTPIAQVAESPLVRGRLTALAQGGEDLGTPLVRNRGTLGGNICNARPAADTLVASLALDARLELRSARGSRMLPVGDFVLAPGKTAIAPDEILTRVVFPADASGSAFYKLANRKALEIAVVNVASALWLDKGKIARARIALGAVGPTPLLARQAAESLVGKKPSADLFAKAGKIAATECKPITDHRGSAGYRTDMAPVLVRRTLSAAVNKI